MGLISYTNLEDATDADANDINARFGAVIDQVNGNLDSTNLANNAVTSAKIADGAVTSAKIDVNKYIDDNGWTVEDYGSTKNYSIRKTGTFTAAHQTWVSVVNMDLPSGITSIDNVFVSLASMVEMAEAVFNIVPSQSVGGKIVVYVYNSHPSNDGNNINFRLDFVVKEQ